MHLCNHGYKLLTGESGPPPGAPGLPLWSAPYRLDVSIAQQARAAAANVVPHGRPGQVTH
jgi:hypothetical protein